jgi:hypothetical protein
MVLKDLVHNAIRGSVLHCLIGATRARKEKSRRRCLILIRTQYNCGNVHRRPSASRLADSPLVGETFLSGIARVFCIDAKQNGQVHMEPKLVSCLNSITGARADKEVGL